MLIALLNQNYYILKKTINHTHQGYPERRNILGNNLVRFKQSIDVFKLISHIAFKIFKTIPQWGLNLYWHPFKSRKATFHFFNGICLSRQQWVSTFETTLPRLGRVSSFVNKMAVRKMAQKNCLQLIAISECTFNLQKKFLETAHPDMSSIILNKTIVLHPPQQVLINNLESKSYTNSINFVFIGADFFRKGGLECLKAFEKIEKSNYSNWHLSIISSLQINDYASHSTSKELAEALDIINSNSKQITLYRSLPNNKVINILKQSHIGLLPTYADTYGYSVLEAQACGCPVITTDIRALPEINNNDCGWVINVPKDASGNGILKTAEERIQFSQTIEEDLYKIVKEILDNPASIQSKGEKALARIKEHHDPDKHSQRLVDIYQKTQTAPPPTL